MKTRYFKVTLLSVVMFCSCKDFLETEPTDFLNPNNYYETEQQLQAARASIYDILGNGSLYGTNTQYLLAWTADEGYMNRSTLTSGPWNYFYGTADPYNTGVWSNLFNGINRANTVLANVDKNPAISQEIRDVIRGEALFLRGYFYFILVQYFGGVPIKTTPTESIVDVNIARNTVREVYDQILADMETAEPLVPGIAALGFGGAVSKSAVRGILARVNLVMAGYPLQDESRYTEVKRWSRMVMDDTEAGHEMNPSYPDIFKKIAGDQYDIKESIWEVEFWGNLTDEYTETGNQGYINGPVSVDGSATGRADSYMSITAKFYNVFEPGDLRKWFSIAHFTYVNGQINGEKTLTDLPSNEAAKYGMRPAKWRREYETLLPKAGARTPQNVPLLRFTDVLLMYAEAENAINGPTAEAVDIVNQVRQRSWSKGVKEIRVSNGGSGYETPPTVVFSAEDEGGAAAIAEINEAGEVVRVVLARDSTGTAFYQEGSYTAIPSVSFQSETGSGATAEVVIYHAADANLTEAQTATKESLLAVIQDERMREFNFELSRKADLLRWGLFLEVHQDMGNTIQQDVPGAFYAQYYSNVSERDLLSPIPDSEISVNRAMVQNPGW